MAQVPRQYFAAPPRFVQAVQPSLTSNAHQAFQLVMVVGLPFQGGLKAPFSSWVVMVPVPSFCHPERHTQPVVGLPVVGDVVATHSPPSPQPAEGHGTHISDAYVLNSGRRSFQFNTRCNAKPASHLSGVGGARMGGGKTG